MYTPIYPKGRGDYGNNVWEVFSPKLNRIVKLYSDLEYDHWLLIEINPQYVAFCEQPKKIVYFWNNRPATSIFDMWIKDANGSEIFIEIKYEKDLHESSSNHARVLKQTESQRYWCLEKGFNYEIRTEKVIRCNKVLLSNAKHMISYLKNRSIPIDLDVFRILGILKEGPHTLSHIFTILDHLPKSRIEETLYRLIVNGGIKSNIETVPIGLNTEVWLND